MNMLKYFVPSFAALAFSVPAHAQFSFQQPEKLFFDAEAGKVEKPFKVVTLAKASGDKAVSLKDKTNKKLGKAPGSEFYEGTIEYKIPVKKEGKYYLWLRKQWEDGCGNSVFCAVNKPMTLKNALVLGEDGTHSKLTWIRLGKTPFHLKEGVNTIRIQNREDGIKLDMFGLIQHEDDVDLDEQYVPTGMEKVNVTPM